MLRTQRSSLCLALAALSFMAPAALAQDDSRTSPTRGPLAERLGRIRRTLTAEFGPDQPTPHVHSTRPKPTEAPPPRMTNQSAIKASTSKTKEAPTVEAKEVESKPSTSRTS